MIVTPFLMIVHLFNKVNETCHELPLSIVDHANTCKEVAACELIQSYPLTTDGIDSILSNCGKKGKNRKENQKEFDNSVWIGTLQNAEIILKNSSD